MEGFISLGRGVELMGATDLNDIVDEALKPAELPITPSPNPHGGRYFYDLDLVRHALDLHKFKGSRS